MEQKKMKCHISIVLENSWKLLGVLLVLVISNLDDIIDNLSEIKQFTYQFFFQGFFGFFVLFALVLIWNLLRWNKTIIWIENATIVVERNTLNKVKNVYNISQISNIDMEQTLFEGIVGTYRIKIDTNTSVAAKSTDIKIVFRKKDAIEFKNHVMEMMGQGILENQIPEEERTFDFRATTKETVLHCIYSMSIISMLLFLGGIIGFIVLIVISSNHGNIWAVIGEIFGGFLAIAIMVISSIYSNLKKFFQYYDFRIRREKDKIFVHSGLLKKNMSTIPVNKINGVLLKQTFISRLFRRYQLEIVNVGMGDEKEESTNLFLSASREEMLNKLRVILPEYEFIMDSHIKKQSIKYFYHGIYAILITLLVFPVCILGLREFLPNLPLWIILLVDGGLFVLILLVEVLSFITSGYRMEQEYVIVSQGVFSKQTTMVAYEKIQQMDIRKNIPSKFSHLLHGTVIITGNPLMSRVNLPYMTEEEMEQVVKKMITS